MSKEYVSLTAFVFRQHTTVPLSRSDPLCSVSTVYCTLTALFVKLEQGKFVHYLFNPTTEVVGYRLVTPFLFTPLGGILYQFKQLTLGHMVFSFGLNNTVNKGTKMALTGPGSTLAS